jgi:hypothetical protein
MKPDKNTLICKYCGKPIFGGKGDYWHIDKYSEYGNMKGPDGHLAYPVKLPKE